MFTIKDGNGEPERTPAPPEYIAIQSAFANIMTSAHDTDWRRAPATISQIVT
jgi:hypothetical protein